MPHTSRPKGNVLKVVKCYINLCRYTKRYCGSYETNEPARETLLCKFGWFSSRASSTNCLMTERAHSLIFFVSDDWENNGCMCVSNNSLIKISLHAYLEKNDQNILKQMHGLYKFARLFTQAGSTIFLPLGNQLL